METELYLNGFMEFWVWALGFWLRLGDVGSLLMHMSLAATALWNA